ncbi:hypothetical protein ACTPGR_002516 [Enterococcus hirae]
MPQTTNRQLTLKKKIGHAFVHQSTNTTLNTESHREMILKDSSEISPSNTYALYEVPNDNLPPMYLTVLNDQPTSEPICVGNQDYSKRNTVLDILEKNPPSSEEIQELKTIINQLIKELRSPKSDCICEEQIRRRKVKEPFELLTLLDNLSNLTDQQKHHFICHFDKLNEEVRRSRDFQNDTPVTKEIGSLKEIREFISANRKKSPAELKKQCRDQRNREFYCLPPWCFPSH